VPAIAAVMAWLLLDEVPPAMAFVGGALCVVGVLVTRKRPKVPATVPD
jgi:drug/metabolite transporter (DMT)-like permease